jgi:hypothetical protein
MFASMFISSWVLFLPLTYGKRSILTIIPLIFLILQIILAAFAKQRKLLFLALISPVTCCALFNIIKPTVNYIAGKPTNIRCSYSPKARTFDAKNAIYLVYQDDDCDWAGLYCYTIEINNFVTESLVKLFGSPLKSASEAKSTGYNMGSLNSMRAEDYILIAPFPARPASVGAYQLPPENYCTG